ncbi:hypothetical protein AUQ48_12005 [Kocuria flava]|uniref:Uncharacterized protein n=1 Tax=Kocuria flava TaxID=446860 RepID=A0A2N4T3P5_9MICC|nr:hypothetical protein [Kocuria flava]PLC12816.1 hypothetical protein AUQ48_12005 [Kocuria flava]
MRSPSTRTVPVTELRRGDRIEARNSYQQRYVGIVDTVARELGMVWIRETHLGERKLLDPSEHQLYRRPGELGRV